MGYLQGINFNEELDMTKKAKIVEEKCQKQTERLTRDEKVLIALANKRIGLLTQRMMHKALYELAQASAYAKMTDDESILCWKAFVDTVNRYQLIPVKEMQNGKKDS